LVTDDSASNGEFLATTTEHLGWAEAGNGLEALAMTVGRTPDLVRLDIQIPGADGYATVAAMREHPTLAETPIFAITAYAVEGDPQKGLDAGFTAY
jgi:CheY-like chemotaxis protein